MKLFKKGFMLAFCLGFALAGTAAGNEKIIAIQEARINLLTKKLELQQKDLSSLVLDLKDSKIYSDKIRDRLACVSNRVPNSSALSCRTVMQYGQAAACGSGEWLTGGGMVNKWGTAMVDSSPQGQVWRTATASWNQNQQTAEEVRTYAICCTIAPVSVDAYCPPI